MTTDRQSPPPFPPPDDSASHEKRWSRFFSIRSDCGGGAQKPASVHTSVLLLILVILVSLVYANTLDVPFIFDDIPNIVDNPHIRWTRFSLDDVIDAAFKSPSSRRPVANVSFALNHYFYGDAVAGYHLVNITIHAISAVMLFFLAKTTLALLACKGGSRRMAPPHRVVGPPEDTHPGCLENGLATAFPFWVAALWLVHPVHTQTVTYIVQRMNGLAAMFSLLALYAYARARMSPNGWLQRGRFVLCALSVVLALGSKENAVTLPFFIFLYEWYFFQGLSRAWIRKQVPLLACLALGAAALIGFYLGASPVARILVDYSHRDFTLIERVLTQFRVVVFYIFLLLWPQPSRLNLDHDFPLSRSLTDPATTLVAVLVVCGMAVAAIATARRHRGISFLLWWFLGNLVVESSVIGLELVFEHRTYLPSITVCCLVVAGAYRWLRSSRLRAAVLAVIVIVFGAWTVARNAVWRDDVTLWADCVAKSPEKARPRNKLGVALERRGRLGEAMVQYRAALRIDPEDAYAYFNMGNIYRKRGNISDAEDSYRKALHLVPHNTLARNNFGVVLADSNRPAAAIAQFRQALADDPGFFLACRNLGGVLIDAGKIPEAVLQLKAALEIRPRDADAHYLLGNAYLRQGKDKSAFGQYILALTYNPDHVGAHTNAGILLAKSGQAAAALPHFTAAMRLRPGDAQVRANHDRALAALKQ